MNPLKLLADKLRGKRRYAYKSAITGRWVSKTHALANPATTVRVRIDKP